MLLPRRSRRDAGAKSLRGGRGLPRAPSSGGWPQAGASLGLLVSRGLTAALGAWKFRGVIPSRLPRSAALRAPSPGLGWPVTARTSECVCVWGRRAGGGREGSSRRCGPLRGSSPHQREKVAKHTNTDWWETARGARGRPPTPASGREEA